MVAMEGVDVLLADGSTVHVRPITPQDADRVVALHSRFSPRTRYLRFFSPYPRIPPRDLARFVNVDHHDREALVAAIGDDLIAIGRYERLGPDAPEAEVAFVVEDDYQGRGVGSMLLEHLASAARTVGLERFVAEVLPENGPMLRVFGDAGYQVTREYGDGAVHLTFPIAPTSRSVSVQQRREQLTEAASIARLLAPRSVAVYGASRFGRGVGATLLRHVREAGFTGTVHPVHRSASTVDGLAAVRSAADAPGPVDLALVAVPAEQVASVVEDAGRAHAHGLVVVSAGFADAGPAPDATAPDAAAPDAGHAVPSAVAADAGQAVPSGVAAEAGRAAPSGPATPSAPAADRGLVAQHALLARARANGLRVVGPNCLGVVNTDPSVRLNASLAPALPQRGRIGIFCQSAAVGIAVLAESARRGVGLSTFVSVGNRADVSGNDLLQFWRHDPATDVVLLYLETFGNPRKFARIARELSRDKPIVAVATGGAGRLGIGPGGLDPQASAALFAHSGVIRVATVAELFDVGQIFATQPLPAGARIGVVGNSAALEALATGACAAAGLATSPLGPADPPLTLESAPSQLRVAVGQALGDDSVDTVLVVLAPPVPEAGLGVDPAALAHLEAVADAAEGADKPVVVTLVGSVARVTPRGGRDEGGALPVFATVEEAVRAMTHVTGYAAWRREPVGSTPPMSDVDGQAARTVAAAGGPAEYLLAAYGVAVVPTRTADSVRSALAAARELGYPVALKAADPDLRHRLDLGAVRLDLPDARALRPAYEEVAERFGAAVLVQPMVDPGVACVVEVVDDAAFGPVVGFGIAGVASDLLGDRAWRAAPLTDRDAAALVRAPRAAGMLLGYRAAPTVDIAALADLLLRVGRLADENPEVKRLVLNPVIAHGEGLSVLHAEVWCGQAAPRPDTGPRQLR